MSIFDPSNKMIKAPIYWCKFIEKEFKPILSEWLEKEFCGDNNIKRALYSGNVSNLQNLLNYLLNQFNSSEEGTITYEVQLESHIVMKPRSRIEYMVEIRMRHFNDKISTWDEMMNILNMKIKVMFTKTEGNFIFVEII